MCLVATDLLFGLAFPGGLESFLTRAAEAIAVRGTETVAAGAEAAPWAGHLWHPPMGALLLSGISWALGAAIVWKAGAVREVFARGAGGMRWGPSQAYELLVQGLNGLARFQTRALQSGYLRY
jgi:hypothetical protein